MKQLLLLIIGLFYTAMAYADCAGNGLWVFPNGNTTRQNGIFVLDGYAASQKVILGLNKEYSIYLKSGSKKIKLLVKEVCVGQYGLTQAILKPETELEAGLEYTMYVDNLPEEEEYSKLNPKIQKHGRITYKVLAGKDVEKPQVLSQPKELKKTLVEYGCGPAVNVVFSNPMAADTDIIVKTTVKNLKTGKETTYYIQPDGDKIKVGHSMCSGAFSFGDGNNYEVEFSFMDLSGNLTAWTGERIKFTKPTKETTPEEE